MQTDFLQFMYRAINDLLTQNLGFFDAMGQNLFRMFATILVAWYGVKSALAAAGGKQSFHFDNFASLLLTISFGFAMVNYYSTPIPGIGSSFHNLITDEAQFLANRINQAELQTIVDRISDFQARIDSPGVTDILGTIMYAVVIIGNLIIGVLTLQPAGTISTLQLIGWFPVLFITFLSSIYVLVKVPALTNHIFSGTAGGSSAGLFEATATDHSRVM